MTIKKLIEQGIEISGVYKIQKYDNDNKKYIILEVGDDFRHANHNDEYLEMNLKSIYSVPIVGTIMACIILEVSE